MAARPSRSVGVVNRLEDGSSGSDVDELTDAQKRTREKAAKRINAALADSASSASEAPSDTEDKPVKVEWSDEGNDGAAAYERFKNRNSRKRKRTRQSKTGVAKRSSETSNRNGDSASRKDARVSEEEDQGLDHTVPDYIKRRRRDLEHNRAEMYNTGLCLPPSYDHIDFSDDERLNELLEKPDFPLLKPCAPYKDKKMSNSLGVIPASIAQWLKPYQVEGAAFLHELFIYQKGGILGDDMGLGKTIQVIACLTAAFGKTGDERDAKRMRKVRRAVTTSWYPKILIVCPGTLIHNWKVELDRWGWWSIGIFHGSAADKEGALQAAQSGRIEIMMTTYATYRLNKGAINMVEWDCVVADECHIIKDRKSEITKSMNDVNAMCRIGLTGTAIQNKYDELWTLLNWTNPGEFGPLSNWRSAIGEPLKLGQAHDATTAQLSKARKTARRLVQNLLPRFFLRRMKSLIADQLPKKSDRVVFCPLTDAQADSYENFVDSDTVRCIRESTQICDCDPGRKRGWCCGKFLPGTDIPWQTAVFPCMAALRNLSNHLGLLIPSSTDPERLNKDLDNFKLAVPDGWKDLYDNRESIVTLANRNFCGKWTVLNKLLKFWHGNGDKVLVFSHSVRLLRLLQLLFRSTSYNVSYLDGSMSYDDRDKTVEKFNSDSNQFVFLISTRAGGVGLNITSANKVVVVDPNWNPSYDLQAQDRAYRIGQTRDVEVFRLISAGTIEEIVYARQIYKQQQANIGYTASLERRYFKGVQEHKDKKGEIFGLQNLFSYQGDNLVLREIVNKTNIAESKADVSVIGVQLESQDRTQSEGDGEYKVKEEDGEDAALSQLAEQIRAGDSSPDVESKHQNKIDAVQAILAGAGVQYTHENSEVIGSSKIEARLSRNAERTLVGAPSLDQAVFQPQSQYDKYGNDDNDDYETFKHEYNDEDTVGITIKRERELKKEDETDSDDLRAVPRGSTTATKHRPPDDVRKRQFCTMAKVFGFDDVAEFALVVESWTQEQRRDCLDAFYHKLKDGKIAF